MNNKFKLIVALVLMLCSIFGNSQSWQWARRGGSGGNGNPDYEQVQYMAVDKQGNTYSVFNLEYGTHWLSQSNAIPNDDIWMASSSKGGVFGIASYTCGGKLRWHKVFEAESAIYSAGIGVDSLDGVYLSLGVSGSYFLINNGNVSNPKSKVMSLLKFDTSGNLKWINQPSADTNSYTTNKDNGTIAMLTTTNGDTYMLNVMTAGPVANSNGVLSVPQKGIYVLKVNKTGIATGLTPLDMTLGALYVYPNFIRMPSGKFLFSCIERDSAASIQANAQVGGQAITKSLLITCFDANGQFLWKTNNKDITGNGSIGISYSEAIGKIFFAAFMLKNDAIQQLNIVNKPGYVANKFPVYGSIDTFGNLLWAKMGYSKYSGGGFFANATVSKDGSRLFCGGGVVKDMNFGNGFVVNTSNINSSVVACFSTDTGRTLAVDTVCNSVVGSSGSSVDVFGTDTAGNVYCGVTIRSQIKIGSQTIPTIGGSQDFLMAKWGYANCPVILSLKFVNYGVQLKDRNVENVWTTASEVNVNRFNIQRSINGNDFETVGVVMAKNKASNSYSFVDENLPNVTTLYYRLQSIDYDGQIQYSELRKVELISQKNEIVIYPNPAKDYINIVGKDIKEIQILDYLGKPIISRNTTGLISLQGINKGLYLIRVITKNNYVTVKKLIKE